MPKVKLDYYDRPLFPLQGNIFITIYHFKRNDKERWREKRKYAAWHPCIEKKILAFIC